MPASDQVESEIALIAIRSWSVIPALLPLYMVFDESPNHAFELILHDNCGIHQTEAAINVVITLSNLGIMWIAFEKNEPDRIAVFLCRKIPIVRYSKDANLNGNFATLGSHGGRKEQDKFHSSFIPLPQSLLQSNLAVVNHPFCETR